MLQLSSNDGLVGMELECSAWGSFHWFNSSLDAITEYV